MKWILLSEHPEEIARGAAFRLPAQRPHEETVEFMRAELPPDDADRMGLTVTTGYEAGLWVVSCQTRRMRRDGRGRCPPRGCSCAACEDIGGFRYTRARSCLRRHHAEQPGAQADRRTRCRPGGDAGAFGRSAGSATNVIGTD
ncbi:hypothetical protein [Streptomyces sp. NPDC052179]|uniref:hypothetical protein n=1 Tax=Streptomyces sp. NPDC052179 TaxID=3155680 RepID=UPI003421FD67